MPNNKGGKNYKKSKHSNDEPVIYERQEDQMYARVIKVLGNCNLIVYCNDGRERLCHIRGSMRKKVWINPGDFVLISIRDEKVEAGKLGKGDICAKYDSSVIHKLKQKDPSINPTLFGLEGFDKGSVPVEEGFEFDGDSNYNDDSDDTNKNIEKDMKFPKNRTAQKQIMEDDDINIDEI